MADTFVLTGLMMFSLPMQQPKWSIVGFYVDEEVKRVSSEW
jgi:hypothetical protein